jgi:hypothetical protein
LTEHRRIPGRWCGVECEGEAPEVIGMTGFGAVGNDGDAAFRCGNAFGFVEVFAQERIDGWRMPLGFVVWRSEESEKRRGGSF